MVIIGALSDQLAHLSDQTLQKVLRHVEGLITFSIAFNRKHLLEILLMEEWYFSGYEGLVKSLKQLPGLLKTERNSEMLRFAIWKQAGVEREHQQCGEEVERDHWAAVVSAKRVQGVQTREKTLLLRTWLLTTTMKLKEN